MRKLSLDHHLLLLAGQRSIPQQNTSVETLKQHWHTRFRAPGLSNMRGWKRAQKEGRRVFERTSISGFFEGPVQES